MFLRLVAAAALMMSLCAGAKAQTSDGDQDSGKTAIPSTWKGPIAEAFYKDATGVALRPEAEAKANFNALSPELQAQVKSDCATMMSATGTDAMATTSTDAGTSAAAGGDADAAQAGTADQVCIWVGQ
jgi:hypothetical protein